MIRLSQWLPFHDSENIQVYLTEVILISISLNSLRPRQNGRHFPDDIFKCIFLNENVGISINISLKFVPKGPVDNIPALGQIMAWRRPGNKPLSEPMMVSLPMHICVTRPQWLKPQMLFAFAQHWSDHPLPSYRTFDKGFRIKRNSKIKSPKDIFLQ